MAAEDKSEHQCSPAAILSAHRRKEWPYLCELGSIDSGSFRLRDQGFPLVFKRAHLLELVQFHFEVVNQRADDGVSPPYTALSQWLLEHLQQPVVDSQKYIRDSLKRIYENSQKKLNGNPSLRKKLALLTADTVLAGKTEEFYKFLDAPVKFKPVDNQAPTPLSDTVGAPSEKDTEENDDHSEGCSTALLIGELLSTDEDDSGILRKP